MKGLAQEQRVSDPAAEHWVFSEHQTLISSSSSAFKHFWGPNRLLGHAKVLGIWVRGTTTISRLTGLLKLDACNRHHPLQRSCMDNIRQCLPSCTMQCSQPQPLLLWEPLRASRGSQEAPAAISARAFLCEERPFCIRANIQIFQSRARGLEDVGSATSSCFV